MSGKLDPVMWATILGSVMPPLVAVVQRSPDPAVRAFTTLLACLVAGLIEYQLVAPGGLADGVNDVNLYATLATVVGFAMTTYRNFWKPTQVAPKVEEATGTRKPFPDPNRRWLEGD